MSGLASNSHTCGLRAARSRGVVFGDEVAIVVERFDRVVLECDIRRMHQEDFCQALGISRRLTHRPEIELPDVFSEEVSLNPRHVIRASAGNASK